MNGSFSPTSCNSQAQAPSLQEVKVPGKYIISCPEYRKAKLQPQLTTRSLPVSIPCTKQTCFLRFRRNRIILPHQCYQNDAAMAAPSTRLSLSVCGYTYMCVRIFVYICVCMFAYPLDCTILLEYYTYMHLFFLSPCVGIHMCVYICRHMCMYVCIPWRLYCSFGILYIHAYVCIYNILPDNNKSQCSICS